MAELLSQYWMPAAAGILIAVVAVRQLPWSKWFTGRWKFNPDWELGTGRTPDVHDSVDNYRDLIEVLEAKGEDDAVAALKDSVWPAIGRLIQ